MLFARIVICNPTNPRGRHDRCAVSRFDDSFMRICGDRWPERGKDSFLPFSWRVVGLLSGILHEPARSPGDRHISVRDRSHHACRLDRSRQKNAVLLAALGDRVPPRKPVNGRRLPFCSGLAAHYLRRVARILERARIADHAHRHPPRSQRGAPPRSTGYPSIATVGAHRPPLQPVPGKLAAHGCGVTWVACA